MEYFRITKYNPAIRDTDGIYRKKDNWTEFCMVKDNLELLDNYMVVEQNYVDFLLEIGSISELDVLRSKGLFLSENGVKHLSELLYLGKFIKKCFIENKDVLRGISSKSFIKTFKGIKIYSLSYRRPEWEDYGIYYLNDEVIFPKNLFESIFKLSLRGFSGMFYFFGKKIKLRFGYNCYLYLSVKKGVITDEITDRYKTKGLFIEKSDDFKLFFREVNF